MTQSHQFAMVGGIFLCCLIGVLVVPEGTEGGESEVCEVLHNHCRGEGSKLFASMGGGECHNPHASSLSSHNARNGILKHQALLGAKVQLLGRREENLGVGLATGYHVAADAYLKVGLNITLLEHKGDILLWSRRTYGTPDALPLQLGQQLL